jgi:hypothetical protein
MSALTGELSLLQLKLNIAEVNINADIMSAKDFFIVYQDPLLLSPQTAV